MDVASLLSCCSGEEKAFKIIFMKTISDAVFVSSSVPTCMLAMLQQADVSDEEQEQYGKEGAEQ